MTRKVLIVVGVLIIVGTLAVAAFTGGLVLGRVTANPGVATPTIIRETEVVTATPNDDGNGDKPPTPEPPMLEPADPSAPTSDTFDYEILQDVLDLLDEQFYGEIPDGQTLAHGAIRGMLMTLDDPYTSFIDPQVTAILNEDASGQFEGIGAMVTMREDGYLEIASLISGQPAEAAGVLPGDIILAVGDSPSWG